MNISPKVKRNQLRLHEEMEETAVLGVDNFTRLTNVSAKYFLHATFLQIRIFHEATTSFLAFMFLSVIAWNTLQEPPYKEKPQHRTGGKCLSGG